MGGERPVSGFSDNPPVSPEVPNPEEKQGQYQGEEFGDVPRRPGSMGEPPSSASSSPPSGPGLEEGEQEDSEFVAARPGNRAGWGLESGVDLPSSEGGSDVRSRPLSDHSGEPAAPADAPTPEVLEEGATVNAQRESFHGMENVDMGSVRALVDGFFSGKSQTHTLVSALNKKDSVAYYALKVGDTREEKTSISGDVSDLAKSIQLLDGSSQDKAEILRNILQSLKAEGKLEDQFKEGVTLESGGAVMLPGDSSTLDPDLQRVWNDFFSGF